MLCRLGMWCGCRGLPVAYCMSGSPSHVFDLIELRTLAAFAHVLTSACRDLGW